MTTHPVNRYSLTDSPQIGAFMELDDAGEWVKFQDIKHLLPRGLDSSRCCPANTPEHTSKCKEQNGPACSAVEHGAERS